MTDKPAIVAYHYVNKEDPALRGVSLTHDPSCTNTRQQVEPLVRLSDYKALQVERDRLIGHIQSMIDQTTPLEPVPGDPMWSRRIQLDEVIAERYQLRAAIRRLCSIYVVDDYYSGEERERRLDESEQRAIDIVALKKTTPALGGRSSSMSGMNPIQISEAEAVAMLAGQKTTIRKLVEYDADVVGLNSVSDITETGVRFNAMDDQRTFLHHIPCPYGKVGDVLWAQEPWATDSQVDTIEAGELSPGEPILYLADGAMQQRGSAMITPGKARPAADMPRWASRITGLQIVSIRAERLKDITEEDAQEEGVAPCTSEYWRDYTPGWKQHQLSARGSFMTLWKSLYGDEAWDANPWVWVIRFARPGAA